MVAQARGVAVVRCQAGHGTRPQRPAGLRSAGLSRRPQPHIQPFVASLTRRQQAMWIAAAGGGDGGSIGGSGSGGGGGGGGGGDGGDHDKQQKPAFGWKGWQDRVAADPQFVYKVVIEQVIGVTANVLGDMASRPNWGLNELDFVFATLVVGSIINFAAVYLLAPVPAAPGGGATLSLASKVFGDYYLNAWGAPPAHMFMPGFSIGSRIINVLYKGVVFSFIGMCAGMLGTATSNGLLALRKKLDPNYTSPNEAPSILGNASCWSLHMGLSANLRYQVLNGLDMVLQPRMPSSVFRLYAPIIRGLNNLGGGMSFVIIAKALGVQKAAEPVHEPVPVAAGKKIKQRA